MKDANELERIEGIKRYLNGEKPSDICKSMGKTKPWLLKWVKRYNPANEDWYKDISKRPRISPKKVDETIESLIIKIRESLMEGSEDSMKYEHVGAESIQYQMEKLEYDSSEIPSLSTIKRIITRNQYPC